MAEKPSTDEHEIVKKEDQSETEGDEEEDEDEDEDEEPRLRYVRVGNDLHHILAKDAASCMAVHQKFLALGTHWGVVYVLDHQGNDISSKKFPSHNTTVNQISIDKYGDYIASCSEDGRVVINGLYSADNNIQLTFDCPVKAVALHPEFGRRGNKQFVVGIGEKLVLYEKSFLRTKSTVIHAGVGCVETVKWRANFVAWANTQSVDIYDTDAKRRAVVIARVYTSLDDVSVKCKICWAEDRKIIIAWGGSIQVCVIKDRKEKDARELPAKFAIIAYQFTTDFYAIGIAPCGSELIVLAYMLNDQGTKLPEKGRAERPHLLIIKPIDYDIFQEVSLDALSIKGFREYHFNHYSLEHVEEENRFYVVSPRDIVVAKPRNIDDHVDWLMQKHKFKDALKVVEENEKDLKTYSVQDVGKAYVDNLIEEKKYDEAAFMCDRILKKDEALWEKEIYRFLKHGQLKVLTPYIPYRDPTLKEVLYELVLNEYLKSDYEGFIKLIKEWPSTLYRPQVIIRALENEIQDDPSNMLLIQSLGILYAKEKMYDKGLAIFLTLRHPEVFDMIQTHNLLDRIGDRIPVLMEIDSKKAVKMFIDNIERIKVKTVVEQLRSEKEYLHKYLDALFSRDPQAGQDFHELQVELYADFERSRLLPFLRQSNYYPLEKALEVCRVRDLIPEEVFLLSRGGNNKKALSLIIDRMHDIEKAIEFAKEQADKELWQDLIDQSLDKPAFIKELLMNIGTHVDPIDLITKIKPKMEIPGLRDALVKILQDYNLQMSLHEGCKAILDKDSVGLMQRQQRAQARGYSVHDNLICEGCQGQLLVDDNRKACNLVLFYCKHYYHDHCLLQTRQGFNLSPKYNNYKLKAIDWGISSSLGLFVDVQYGLRHSWSTGDLLIVITEHIYRFLDRTGEGRAIALDASKALDKDTFCPICTNPSVQKRRTSKLDGGIL